ncbi:MAG: energy transducer TonB [Pseudomonadota bacterium]
MAPSEDSTAMVAAKVGAALMKVVPRLIRGGVPVYPASELAAGHSGTVKVRGILGIDGKLSELVVTQSAGFPGLDDAALATAQRATFSPARTAAGDAIAIPVTMPVRFALEENADNGPPILTRVEAIYPDAERAAGRHGKVEITGTLGEDGKLIDPVVAVSSRAPVLDEAALTAARATVFRVDRNTAGKPVLPSVRLPFSFNSYQSPGPGGGVLRYRCGQFATDQAWWRATWPEKTHDAFYYMIFGLRTIVMMQGEKLDPATLKGNIADFGQRWTKAIDTCREQPDMLFIDVFKPEGDWARRLAGNGL